MTATQKFTVRLAVALLLGAGLSGCNTRSPATDDAAPAPVDTNSAQAGTADTTSGSATTDTGVARTDTTAMPKPRDTEVPAPDTSVATPPITPPAPAGRDTPPTGAAKPSQPSNQAPAGQGLKVSAAEYEGWRQYSVNCARCHGQDVLPNPVAANLLVSLGPNGPVNTPEKFRQVTSEGRPDRGMPAFKSLVTPTQIDAMHAYVKGRAEGRIPPGRPDKP